MVSRDDSVAPGKIGEGAGIAGAYKQVGGYARSVKELYSGLEMRPAGAFRADQIVI